MTGALVSTALTVISPASAPAFAAAASATPVASRPDAYAAMMAAKKQDSRVEVLDDRTDASQTFANSDGTFTYEKYAAPKWVYQDGSWKVLDPTLVKDSAGDWAPALSESVLKLSGGGSGPLAIMTVDGKQLSLTWPSVLPTPTASGATLTYPAVLSGVDLQVTATAAGGVEETLVIEDATAAADPALADLVQTVNTSNGTTAATDAGGNLTDTDTHGDVLVNSPSPVMWDSAATADVTTRASDSSFLTHADTSAGSTHALAHVTPASLTAQPGTRSTVHAPGMRAHQAPVRANLKNHKLHLVADKSLLAAKSTVFPVYIDPAYTPHPASGSTLNYDEVQQAYPTTSNWDTAPSNGNAVGYQGFSSPTGIERTYYNLRVPSTIFGATILSATLNTTVSYAAASGSTTTAVDLYSTCSISTSTTWNNQPCKDSSVNPNYPNPVLAKSFTTTSQSPNLAVAFNVQASMQLLANGSHSNWTIGLFNATETDDTHLVRFATNPSFSITYNHPPVTPTNLSMTPSNVVGSTYTSSGTPTLSASATDADSDTVQLSYQILSGSTVTASGTTAFVNSGTAATWKPSSALADGSYTWKVRAYDGNDYSAWSAAQAFTVDTSTPPAPSVSCPGYPHGVWTAAISGGTTCSLSDTASDVMGFSWGIDSGNGTWTSGTSATISINPPAGYHTLWVSAYSNADKQGTETYYVFGVGSAGMTSPADQSATSTTLPLSASAPTGASTVTFKYRVGASGSFTSIPTTAVTQNGTAISAWPLNTVSGTNEVTSPNLVWNLTQTVTNDGLLQVEAQFGASNGNTVVSPPVSVTLDRLGTGTDFGTTQAGPVTVGLQSGNASVTSTDVSVASYGSGLSVDRTFNSLKPTAVNTGFGPGWTTSLPVAGTSASWASVTDKGTYALLTGHDGSGLTFAAGTASNGTTPYTGQGPAAASGLTLTKGSTGFTLADSTGTVVTFVVPAGGTSGLYLPATVTQPGSAKATGFIYDPNSGATQGKLMLMVAPNAASSQPATSACPYPATSGSWAAGCRGLQFTYDGTSGNISEIDFLTSDGTTLTKTAAAKYTYDASGRLATEWDPRISPALVATYTYDETSTDADYGRLLHISPAQSTAGSLAPWVLVYNDDNSSADYGKLASITRTHNSANGTGIAKTVISYSVPLTTAAGGPASMDAATTAGWGQSDNPVSAVAIFPPDHAPSSNPPTDWTYAQILYYDSQGREVNTASYNNGWNITTTEYDQNGNSVRELSATNRASALAAGSTSATVAAQLDTENLYSSDGTELTDSYGPAHQATAAGSIQTIRTHTHDVYDQGAPNSDKDANGNPYQLVTSEIVSASLGASVPGSNDVDSRTTSSVYNKGSDNEGWTLHTPLQTVTDPGTGHLNISNTVAFNEDSSLYGGEPLQIASSQPSDTAQTGAGTTKTIYYTAGTNSVDGACGNQPVWADLVCKTKPAAQPNTSGLANLPVTTYTYNVYLQPLTKTETYTAADSTTATRTTTTAYDAAARTTRSDIATTGTGMGSAVAPAKTLYSSTTGLPSDLQNLDASGNATADLKTSYDDFGNPSSYTDATGRVTNYTYDLAERVISRSDNGDTTTYTYNGGTVHDGSLTSENDSRAGTFGAGYGPDGNLVNETYPGSTTATYTVDATGAATSLTYTNSNWSGPLTDSVQTNDAGDWANRSELSTTKTYSYDAADRLTTVADTQSGQCTTRAYGYEVDSNRTNLTTSAPKTDGTCQTSTSTAESHAYDAADRITDTGYTYDTLGDITTTPSVDAGGSSNLTAGYFANGMLASQTQAGSTNSWTLDPTGTRVSIAAASSGITFTNDYADPSDKPDLITASNGAWTRNVLGPDDHLAATVTASGVTLQLMDLHGDLMATEDLASNSVTSTNTYSEFGLVETGTAASYGWAAGAQRENAGQAGQILMDVRGYNPYLGRFDQRDPVPGGSANAYDYADQNPVNNSDISGRFTFPHGHSTCGYTTCTFYLSRWGTEHLYIWMADHGWTYATVAAAVGSLMAVALCADSGMGPYCAVVAGTYLAVLASEIIDEVDSAHNHHQCFAMKTTFPTWTAGGLMFVPLYPEHVKGRNCW
ncbi:RHS repeat-associated core domain-containing protein [Streptomyces sp. NPDC005483]|uniref:RHS repeat-associated core domain-containing protein n=1 Tax=Streptomyces sp. NPDC005483 TaxID=3154882 RepID=UPI0033B61876